MKSTAGRLTVIVDARLFGVAALLLIVLGFTSGDRAQAATVSEIEVLTEPEGEQVETVELEVAPGTEDAQKQVFLRTSDGESLDGVELSADLGVTAVEFTAAGQEAGAEV